MLTGEVVVTIPGHPAPKGSMKCVGRHLPGHGPRLVEDSKRTKDWRATVASWTKRKTISRAEPGQPIGTEVTFTLPRPKGHYRTGKNAHILKDTAPSFPVSHSTGDVDKLLRLALDALQDASTLPDDCAVVEVTARKAYPTPDAEPTAYDVLPYPGVRIRLYPIGDPT